jgi:hypothetical protein
MISPTPAMQACRACMACMKSFGEQVRDVGPKTSALGSALHCQPECVAHHLLDCPCSSLPGRPLSVRYLSVGEGWRAPMSNKCAKDSDIRLSLLHLDADQQPLKCSLGEASLFAAASCTSPS